MQKINLVMSNKIYNIAFMENKELEEAIKVLQKHLKENGDYYNNWIVNLGKYFINEYKVTEEKHKISEIAFKAAKNFLDNLIKE